MADLNPLYDPKTDNLATPPEVQTMLNQAPKADSWTSEEQTFLTDILAKVEAGTIQLYSPSSLLNAAVYEALSPELKAKADQSTPSMLTAIREIVNLMKLNPEPSTAVQSLVGTLLVSKKRLEEAGDIFII
ncbi:MAG: hypothetical protein WC777_00425 [Candidatus Gracilibacteria bacterium]|jgi:hypothetical protein